MTPNTAALATPLTLPTTGVVLIITAPHSAVVLHTTRMEDSAIVLIVICYVPFLTELARLFLFCVVLE
jgi:hypothetical protein